MTDIASCLEATRTAHLYSTFVAQSNSPLIVGARLIWVHLRMRRREILLLDCHGDLADDHLPRGIAFQGNHTELAVQQTQLKACAACLVWPCVNLSRDTFPTSVDVPMLSRCGSGRELLRASRTHLEVMPGKQGAGMYRVTVLRNSAT